MAVVDHRDRRRGRSQDRDVRVAEARVDRVAQGARVVVDVMLKPEILKIKTVKKPARKA